MLIEFTVGNCLSFKEKVTFYMEATKDKSLQDTNTFEYKSDESYGSRLKLNLLRTTVIYGANASGKSNFLKAMNCMRSKVIGQFKLPLQDANAITPFKLDNETPNNPSYFEIIFIENRTKYRFGFEADNKKIHKEWLYYTRIKEINLYTRDSGEIKVSDDFKEGKFLKEIKDDTLFLTTMAQFIKNDRAKEVSDWFENLTFFDNTAFKNNLGAFFSLLFKIKEPEYKNKILPYIHEADFGIDDVFIKESLEIPPMPFPPGLKPVPSIQPLAKHGNFTLGFLNEESNGTKVFLSLIGLFLNIAEQPKVFIIDELESNLHPYLLRLIIGLFNSIDTNPNNAQLIFTAHNTNLLDDRILRKDQIWFCEKDKNGVTNMFSLCEFKVPKKSLNKIKSYEKDYLLGKYGAVPTISKIKR